MFIKYRGIRDHHIITLENIEVLLIISGITYKYSSWERFDEKLLPKKANFNSSLNMEDITDVHYRLVKRVLKIFNNRNIGIMTCMFKVIH